MPVIRIGTRASRLALWQANHVANLLVERFSDIELEIVPIRTQGDERLDVLLSELGGKGLFIKELEIALRDRRIDLAVHSMKDVTVRLESEFCIAAILERDNPYDAFVSSEYHSLENLPKGASIGTCSLRRQSQILSLRPDLQVVPIRGNVQTRLRQLDEGDVEAVLLAVSGLNRLGLEHRITQVLSEHPHIPSPGQGALGVECRSQDVDLIEMIRLLSVSDSEMAVSAERRINAGLGGSCHVPVGVLVKIDGNFCEVSSWVSTIDAKRTIVEHRACLVDALAQECDSLVINLFEKGAKDILESCGHG